MTSSGAVTDLREPSISGGESSGGNLSLVGVCHKQRMAFDTSAGSRSINFESRSTAGASKSAASRLRTSRLTAAEQETGQLV